MDTEIIVAIITVVGTIVGNYLVNVKKLALIEQKLNIVEKKVDEHNGYAKMFHESHEDISLIKQEIGFIKEKINK